MKKLFSIIVALYNTEEYLKECIESVINQTLNFEENVELILINDGSTDNSEKICLEYKKRFPQNIIYLYQKNKGVSVARNEGIKISTGKYINFLDSDDKFSLNFLEIVKKVFEEQSVNICAVRPEFFDKISGNTSVDNCFKTNRKVNIINDENYTQQAVNNVFIKKSIIKNHFFSENLSIGEDAMFINSLFLKNPIYYVTNSATYYQRRRQNNDSLSESAFKKKTFYVDTVDSYFLKIINIAKDEIGVVPIFLQKDIARYIAWMLQSNVVDEVLNTNEIKQLIKKLEVIVKDIDKENILNDKEIEIEYKYILLKLKKENVNIFYTDQLIKIENDTKYNDFKYIFVNHSLNNYILKNDDEKIILYALEMNKFYNKLLKENNEILKREKTQNENITEMQKKFNKRINDLNKEKEKIENQYTELQIKLKNVNDNYITVTNEYKKIINSKSWKITSPLRKIRKIVKKEVKK